LTINEIKEVLVQMYAYTDSPRSLNASDLMSVIEERERKGIKDELGREASPLPANKAGSNSERKFNKADRSTATVGTSLSPCHR